MTIPRGGDSTTRSPAAGSFEAEPFPATAVFVLGLLVLAAAGLVVALLLR